MNKTKTKKLHKHTMLLLKQDRRNNNKNSKQKLCKHTMSRYVSIVSNPKEDGKFKSKESQSYIIINIIAQSQFHTKIKTK